MSVKPSLMSILGCGSRDTHPTLRAAFRNSNNVWTRYRPSSERRTSGTEGMTIVTAGSRTGRVAKEKSQNLQKLIAIAAFISEVSGDRD